MSPEIDTWIDAWRGPLVGLLRARGLPVQEAEEVAQETFAEAWLGRARFRAALDDERAVGAWLAGIARNLHRARQRRRPTASLEADPPAPAETDRQEDDARVRAAIERLPDGEREVVRMFYLEETSTRRVAALLELSERAVEGRLRRARERLSQFLTPGAAPTTARTR